MRRLYRQFYLTIVASLILVVLVAGALWRFAPNPPPGEQVFAVVGELAAALVPPADQGAAGTAGSHRAAAHTPRRGPRAVWRRSQPHRSRRAVCPATAATPQRRLGLRRRWPGLGHSPSRRPLDRRPYARTAHPPGAGPDRLPRQHRPGDRAVRLSARAPPDAPAGAAAGGGRVAWRRGSRRPRRGPRQGRGGAPGAELQPLGRTHRGAGRFAQTAAGQCLARAADAALPHPPRRRVPEGQRRSRSARPSWNATSPSSTP